MKKETLYRTIVSPFGIKVRVYEVQKETDKQYKVRLIKMGDVEISRYDSPQETVNKSKMDLVVEGRIKDSYHVWSKDLLPERKIKPVMEAVSKRLEYQATEAQKTLADFREKRNNYLGINYPT